VTGEEETLAVTGFFVAVGHDPRSGLVRDAVETDDEGYVRVALPGTGTNIPGVFACGDLVDHTYRQAVTAAGSGCQASIDAERWLAEQPDNTRDTAPPPTPGVDGAQVDGLASVGPATARSTDGATGGSVDEGSPEPAGDAVPAPS
jgi:thioredoxin reductase (NADPH)